MTEILDIDSRALRASRLARAGAIALAAVLILSATPRLLLTIQAWRWPTTSARIVEVSTTREQSGVHVGRYRNTDEFEERLRIRFEYPWRGGVRFGTHIEPLQDYLPNTFSERQWLTLGRVSAAAHVSPDGETAYFNVPVPVWSIFGVGLSVVLLWWARRPADLGTRFVEIRDVDKA